MMEKKGFDNIEFISHFHLKAYGPHPMISDGSFTTNLNDGCGPFNSLRG